METAKVDKALKDITQELRDYTKDTVDDSAIVKIITLVSTFYLPGSFVSVHEFVSRHIPPEC